MASNEIFECPCGKKLKLASSGYGNHIRQCLRFKEQSKQRAIEKQRARDAKLLREAEARERVERDEAELRERLEREALGLRPAVRRQPSLMR